MMTKTHYQAPWNDQDSTPMCNDTITADTTPYIDLVDCKRCLKMIEAYKKKGKRFKTSKDSVRVVGGGVKVGVVGAWAARIFKRVLR